MLYGIDSQTDTLVIQNPPNNGTLVPVGALGVNTNDEVGFDITKAPLSTLIADLEKFRTREGKLGLTGADWVTVAATPASDGSIGDRPSSGTRDCHHHGEDAGGLRACGI